MRIAIITMLLHVWVLLLSTALGSPGDNLDEFAACRRRCERAVCRGQSSAVFAPVLRWNSWLQWDCPTDCDYQCQRLVTADRRRAGEDVVQFHGKWPFRRVLGMQEFMLVVFLVANFVPHYHGFQKMRRAISQLLPAQKPLAASLRNIQFMALVAMCAWVFSAVFHTRDYIFTERLDYFFAGLTVLTGFHGIGHRFLRLYRPARAYIGLAFSAACAAAYAVYFHRLVLDWLYTYNMRANIAVGVAQNITWILTCFLLYTRHLALESERRLAPSHLPYAKRVILPTFFKRSAKFYSLYPVFLCFIVACGMSFEIFDFAPVFFDLVDAHAIWHFVTVFPACYGWYDWILWDVHVNIWDDVREKTD